MIDGYLRPWRRISPTVTSLLFIFDLTAAAKIKRINMYTHAHIFLCCITSYFLSNECISLNLFPPGWCSQYKLEVKGCRQIILIPEL